MEQDVGRGRHGRDTSKAHASARSKGAAPAPKRGRGKHGQHVVQGSHDNEAGGSGGSRSRARSRSRLGQAHVDAPVAEPDFDANQYINDDAEYAEDTNEAHQQAPPQEQPQEAEAEEQVVYGGGPHDLSLLSEYHKHRSIDIWEADSQNHKVR